MFHFHCLVFLKLVSSVSGGCLIHGAIDGCAPCSWGIRCGRLLSSAQLPRVYSLPAGAGGLANCFLHSSFGRRLDLIPGFCTLTVGGRGLCCLEVSLGRLAVGRLVPRIVCLVGSIWVSINVLSFGWLLGTQLLITSLNRLAVGRSVACILR